MPSKKAVSNKAVKGSNSSMNDLLECPICGDHMYSPIYQCSNGHTICFKCKARVNNICPSCRQELGNIRCLALEKVAERLNLPCNFHVFGCQSTFSYHTRLWHEKTCNFRPFNCPFSVECSVTGDIRSLVAHLKEDHSIETRNLNDRNTFEILYVKSKLEDFENKTWSFKILNYLGHQFFLHFEACNIGNAPVFMAFLRFMGNDDKAKIFRYSLEVGGKERMMTWQGIPRSIRDSSADVRDSLDGLVILRNLAIFFSDVGQEMRLKVKGRIWRVEDCSNC